MAKGVLSLFLFPWRRGNKRIVSRQRWVEDKEGCLFLSTGTITQFFSSLPNDTLSTAEYFFYHYFYFIHKQWVCTIDKALATRFIDDCVSEAWQLRWASHLNPLAHILLALPYLGLTAAEGNNVCQESVKLEPKPTLLFKSTSQVPTSLLIAKLTMSNTNKPANSIRTPLLWDSGEKETLWTDSLTTLHRTFHHEEVAFIHQLQCASEATCCWAC